MTYNNIPEHFTWNKSCNEWNVRQKYKKQLTIGRVYHASPSHGPRYYLRVLLCNVKGPTSYKYLRTYKNIEYKTFHEAAIARNLVDNDVECYNGMYEADKIGCVAHELRSLFLEYLIYSKPCNVKKFFYKFIDVMSDDIAQNNKCKELKNNKEQYDKTIRSVLILVLNDMIKKMTVNKSIYLYEYFKENRVVDNKYYNIYNSFRYYKNENIQLKKKKIYVNEFLKNIETINIQQSVILYHMIQQIHIYGLIYCDKLLNSDQSLTLELREYFVKKKKLFTFIKDFMINLYDLYFEKTKNKKKFENNKILNFHNKIFNIIKRKINKKQMKLLYNDLKKIEFFKKKPKNITFLNAFAGTGKTWLINNLIIYCKSLDLIVLPVSSSGIAATLLTEGETLHSRFQIPIDVDKNTPITFKNKNYFTNLILKTFIIIYDECLMHKKECLIYLNRLLKEICHVNEKYACKTIFLSGDYRQILPIIQYGSRYQQISACLHNLSHWNKECMYFGTLNINERIMRQISNKKQKNIVFIEKQKEFAYWTLKIGDGCKSLCLNDSNLYKNVIEIDKKMVFEGKLDKFCDEIYPFLSGNVNLTENKKFKLTAKYFYECRCESYK